MAFLDELASKLHKIESETLFSAEYEYEDFYKISLILAKKYDVKVPKYWATNLKRLFEDNSSKKAYGRDPIRKTIYIYPHQLKRIESLAKKRGISKRWILFEAFNFYLTAMEKLYGK